LPQDVSLFAHDPNQVQVQQGAVTQALRKESQTGQHLGQVACLMHGFILESMSAQIVADVPGVIAKRDISAQTQL
jgi:hypothetical protein